MNRERTGLGFAGLCALIGAFVAPVARFSTEQRDPLFVATVTTLLAGLGVVATGVTSFVRAPHAVEKLERVPTQTAPLGADAGSEAGGTAA